MSLPERRFAVDLGQQRVGILHAKADTSWFVLDRAYVEDPDRAVLGLRFEEDLRASHRATKLLPPWFSNLLPEGSLRDWIAAQRGVRAEREVELLAEVGHDLPGAVVVTPTVDEPSSRHARVVVANPPDLGPHLWRFSLAGVQMKFSMLSSGERFTVPASGEGGDWIVKLPDPKFQLVPRNEHAMMALAKRAGLDVPETRLVPRDLLPVLPDRLWPSGELQAYAVQRFDRGPGRTRVHMEDLAQVRGFYPPEKYQGSFETVASLIYRRRDEASLREFARRLAFNVLIQNADAHLKNWSLLYRNPRLPVLSPAYDLVATGVYSGVDRDLGLRFCGSRRLESVTLNSFAALQKRLGVTQSSLAEEADQVVELALAAWPEIEDGLRDTPLGPAIGAVLRASSASIRRSG